MDSMRMTTPQGRTIGFSVVDIVPPWRRDGMKTIVFHHGIAVDRHLWAEWLPELAGRYRLVTFDMFGSGQSSRSDRREDWTPAARVEDLIALADQLDIADFHLVGESYGGTVAMMAALQAPDRIRSLTLCNASHQGGSIRSANVWSQMLDREGVAGWAAHMMGQRFFPDTLPEEMEAWMLERQSTTSRESIEHILRELIAVEIADKVAAIEVPVLMMIGDSSPFISVSVMDDLHHRLPDSELHVFGRARHGLPFSHGRECAAVMGDFLWRRFSEDA
jgi:pimeloyl-ACP methyl ester carboxylesterase